MLSACCSGVVYIYSEYEHTTLHVGLPDFTLKLYQLIFNHTKYFKGTQRDTHKNTVDMQVMEV